MSIRRRAPRLLALWASSLIAAVVAAQPLQIPAGVPVAEALELLRAAGLDLVYSDRLVRPELRVEADPGPGSPEEVAARVLAPHGLRLEAVRAGRYAVVRSATASPAGASASARVTPVPAIEAVTVYASRYRIEALDAAAPSTLSRSEIAVLPGIDEDILRVARYFPGTASSGLSARSNVRGGRDDEVAVWFDGVPLFEPFHFKDYNAELGVFDPAAIERLDFYSGVFPVRYGDRLSAVMDITPRQARTGVHHELGLSLLAAHALSAGEAQWRNTPLRWLASARSSTTQLVARTADRNEFEPEFSDLLLRIERGVGDSTLAAGVLALRDELWVRDEGSGGVEAADARYRDGLGWLRYTRSLTGGGQFEATLSLGSRETDRTGSLARAGSVAGSVEDRRRIQSRYLRLEWRDPSRWLVGIEATESEARYDYRAASRFDPVLAELFGREPSFARTSRTYADGTGLAAYASRLFEFGADWRLDAGLRAESQAYHVDDLADPLGRRRLDAYDTRFLSPRLALEYALDARTTLRLSAGRTSQGTRPDELLVADGDVDYPGRQAADQVVLGLDRRLGQGGSWRIEAYRKDVRDPTPRYENVLDPVTLLPELEVDRQRVTPSAARLYGIELSGRWQWTPRWSGWSTYAWSEAKDRVDGHWVARSWNQLHALSAGAAWAQGPWELSANLRWHSGWRQTTIDATAVGLPVVRRNGTIWGDYLSLDLRSTWSRPLPHGALRLWVDVSNATGRANPCCSELAVQRSGATPGIERRQREWLPRYAIVGVTWELL
ncbi:MAG: TonB-dependent receptor plug domain-containing protein [Gammaproteobacteria bacterium]|nr:TonB-dependent receptor plug domain-containing protein [Gammaproteobacteria bacterium]